MWFCLCERKHETISWLCQSHGLHGQALAVRGTRYHRVLCDQGRDQLRALGWLPGLPPHTDTHTHVGVHTDHSYTLVSLSPALSPPTQSV